MIAFGAEFSFHLDSFFQYFSCFKQVILHHVQREAQPGGGFPAGETLKVIGHGAFPVFPGEQRQLPPQNIEFCGFQDIPGEVVLICQFFVQGFPAGAAFAPQKFFIGVCRDGPDVSEKGMVVPESVAALQDGKHDVSRQIFCVLFVGDSGQGIGEDGFHIFFHQCGGLFLCHGEILLCDKSLCGVLKAFTDIVPGGTKRLR